MDRLFNKVVDKVIGDDDDDKKQQSHQGKLFSFSYFPTPSSLAGCTRRTEMMLTHTSSYHQVDNTKTNNTRAGINSSSTLAAATVRTISTYIPLPTYFFPRGKMSQALLP